MSVRRLPPSDNPFRPVRCRDLTLLFLAALAAVIPLAIIRAYRLIPPRVRDAVFTSTGASTRALADITAGANPWAALWHHGGLRVHGWATFPSWTDPGPQGFVSAAWKLGEGGKGAP